METDIPWCFVTVYVYAAADIEYQYQNSQSVLAISGGFTANPPTRETKTRGLH